MASEQPISRPPTAGEIFRDRLFRGATLGLAWFIVFLVVGIVVQMAIVASPTAQRYGLGFLTSEKWDNGREEFGIAPEIWGTVYSSVLGVAIGAFFGLAVAIFLTQDFLPPKLEVFVKNVV